MSSSDISDSCLERQKNQLKQWAYEVRLKETARQNGIRLHNWTSLVVACMVLSAIAAAYFESLLLLIMVFLSCTALIRYLMRRYPEHSKGIRASQTFKDLVAVDEKFIGRVTRDTAAQLVTLMNVSSAQCNPYNEERVLSDVVEQVSIVQERQVFRNWSLLEALGRDNLNRLERSQAQS